MNRPAPALVPAALAVLALAATAALPSPALAQAQGTTIEEVECIPNNDNGVVRTTVRPEIAGAEVRLYFRWEEHGPFYYVLMEAAGDGLYWATPPKPTDENHQVEVYVAQVNPAGQEVGTASEPMLIPVTRDCDVRLDTHERGMAENLVVGETDPEQMDRDVWGFLCDGIISRIDPEGVLRADGICRRCIVAWWDKPESLVPAAVLLGGGTSISIEASPSRP
jgi:hypothetical protein